jgi:hypothetical protein
MMHIFISASGDDIRAGRDRQGGPRLPGLRARRGGPPPPPRHRPAGGEGPHRLPLFRRPAAEGLRPERLERHRATPTARTRRAISGSSPARTT